MILSEKDEASSERNGVVRFVMSACGNDASDTNSNRIKTKMETGDIEDGFREYMNLEYITNRSTALDSILKGLELNGTCRTCEIFGGDWGVETF
jgi:hypothetical protein